MTFDRWFQILHPEIPTPGMQAVLELTAEGATIPFIARYRKEKTGNLDEVAIQLVIEGKEKWDKIVDRKKFILGEIDRQGKLTEELRERIDSTFQLELLEDLYLPYRQKRKTKASLAREAGLEPLADWIWACGHGTETPQPGQTLEIWAFTFRNEEKGFPDAAAAIQGAQDILTERISEIQSLRQFVRSTLLEKGTIRTQKGAKAKTNSKYENYFQYRETVSSLLQPKNSHRYLALRRGWIEEELTISFGGPTDLEDAEFDKFLLAPFEAEACSRLEAVGADVLLKAAKQALKAHVRPSIESEAHKALKEVADQVAIGVFSENVKKLLMASPFGPKAVLGVDPGVRTGCKLAVITDTGRFIANTVIHLQSEEEKSRAKDLICDVVKTGNIQAIAVGNGTAGRETEIFFRLLFKERNIAIPVVMVNEAGASVYSASEVAREEFPDLDVTVRGAISIARRLQDPLAELVKIDPKSIGVGQYQHDVSPHALKRCLDWVVESCVNQVGVNLNTASDHLLTHVSGIGASLAKNIVEHRSRHGLFKSREHLLEVPRFSKKAFEQAAGFLRIPEAENPLDHTGIHPESYPVLENLASRLGKRVSDFLGSGVRLLKDSADVREEIGTFTFDDIVAELAKPGRDPRDEFVPFQFRDDVYSVKDLKAGMICPGIVTNVTNFGAFVDIGVHQDGLVHVSQLSRQFIQDPKEVVCPGDRVQVKVLEINLEKNQIALTMKEEIRQKKKMRTKLTPAGPSPIQPKTLKSRKPIAPKAAFNNPFGSLASLRDHLKPKGR